MSGRLTLFGVHAALSLLRNQPGCVAEVVLARGGDRQAAAVAAAAAAAGVRLSESTRRALDDACGGAAHQGVLLHCKRLPELDDADLARLLDGLETACLLLLLDGVQDPHNLGACLRTAEAAGVHAVVVPRDRACGMTSAVVKVASGAAGVVPFVRTANLARCLQTLRRRDVWVVGASHDAAQSLYQVRLTGRLALVLGAEGRGLRRLTREGCDELARIPLHGSVASLNVSVAAGVVIFEALRQRAP